MPKFEGSSTRLPEKRSLPKDVSHKLILRAFETVNSQVYQYCNIISFDFKNRKVHFGKNEKNRKDGKSQKNKEIC